MASEGSRTSGGPTGDGAGRASTGGALPAGLSQEQVWKEAFLELLDGGPFDPTELATRLGAAVDGVGSALASLADRGRVQLDEDGRVIGAAGLSLRPTRHRLVLDGVERWTWCAIDAIGIPAALGRRGVAITSCPTCGRELRVEVVSGAVPSGSPERAWLPSPEGCTNVLQELCPQANLFCNEDHLELWRTGNGQPQGVELSIEQVAEMARRWWGDAR